MELGNACVPSCVGGSCGTDVSNIVGEFTRRGISACSRCFPAVELLAVDAQRLQELGLAAAGIKRLPRLGALVDSVRSAMMELPQGLARIEGPVAIAVWGEQANQAELISLLVRTD
ncbi:MAG: hypothetical protein ACI9G5_000476 [Paracoccaceae bacterium]|jgi:hypothetical protein